MHKYGSAMHVTRFTMHISVLKKRKTVIKTTQNFSTRPVLRHIFPKECLARVGPQTPPWVRDYKLVVSCSKSIKPLYFTYVTLSLFNFYQSVFSNFLTQCDFSSQRKGDVSISLTFPCKKMRDKPQFSPVFMANRSTIYINHEWTFFETQHTLFTTAFTGLVQNAGTLQGGTAGQYHSD